MFLRQFRNGLDLDDYLVIAVKVRNVCFLDGDALVVSISRKERKGRKAVEEYAVPYLPRAYFFDNSNADMRYLASYSCDSGFEVHQSECSLPRWFRHILTCRAAT